MLFIIATPIGNLEDISIRALRILSVVNFILAEDTRKTGVLLKRFGIKKKMVSFYEHNEAEKIPWLVGELKSGKSIALVSSAGTPAISDPGYKLVRECRKQRLAVTSLPGPSSITNLLALTSLPHDKFTFLGYLPRKVNDRQRLLLKVKEWKVTFVFFESPFRILKTLSDLKKIFGNGKIVIAREMTKKFEEFLELSIEEGLAHFHAHRPKGEFTLAMNPLIS